MSQTLALTGATGFVGGHVLDQALASGYQVRALARRDQPARDGVTWIRGDLADHAALTNLCGGADAVLHIAGVVNAPDAAGFEAGNVAGTANVVAAAKAAGVARFVHVSSLSAREPDLSQYGGSKARAEAVVAASGLDWTMVRPPAIYGPGDTEMLDLFKAAKLGIIPLPPHGRLSVIHAADLARLLLALATQQAAANNRIFEADDGQPGGWTHVGFARALGKAFGKKVWPVSLPAPVIGLGARIDGLLRGKKAKLTADRAAYFCNPDWVIDDAARPPASLWVPQIDTQDGVKDTADWYRQRGWI